jgi:hypothetical protein
VRKEVKLMKWSVTIKKNETSKKMIDSIGGVPVLNVFGMEKGYVAGIVTAKNDKTGGECYFVQLSGSPLFFLEQFIELRLLRRSNLVVPYWITERGRA